MNTQHLLTSLLFGLIVVLPDGYVAAQNPLRHDQPQMRSQTTASRPSGSYYHEVFKQDSSTDYGNRIPIISPGQALTQRIQPQYRVPRRNDDVVLSGFQEMPKPDRNQPDVDRSAGNAQVLGSAIDQSWQDPKKIVDLIMKISLNLIFVLCFAVGVILVLKKFGKARDGNQNSDRAKSDSLSVLQTLRIDPKISIRLVQWRANRFLVACDQNGIQSVNPLNESFEQTLNELDGETPTDEKLLQKLLSSLEGNRG